MLGLGWHVVAIDLKKKSQNTFTVKYQSKLLPFINQMTFYDIICNSTI